MVRSRTMTAPTNLRGQVDREATTAAMFMKYWSQDTRSMGGSVTVFGVAHATPLHPFVASTCCMPRNPGSIRRAVDWKTTLNLPKTEFPMRADLARREPEWL